MTGRRAAALVTGVMALLVLLVPAAPAGADTVITLDDLVVSGANVTVSGRAEVLPVVEVVTRVTIGATSTRHPEFSPSPCHGCGADLTTGQSMVSFSHTFEGLAVNGPYDLTVEVESQNLLGETRSVPHTVNFRIAVPPAAPSNVATQPNPDGTVTVRWYRNTEPDLVGYRVERRDLAGGPRTDFDVAQPADGATVVWTDTTAGMAGRRVQYQVVALRLDGDGSGRIDASSAPALATVPASATPAAGLPGGGAAPGSGGPGTLPSLASGVGPIGRPVEPDGTFSQTLPFGGNKPRADLGGADDAVATLGDTTNKRAIVLPIAAGLFMCVAAAHLRRFSRRMFPTSLDAEP